MKVCVVGLGLIGGSMALSLRQEGFATELIGVDESEEHCRQALALKLVDSTMELEEAAKHADLIVIAVPVNATIKLLPEILDLVDESTTVTDVGSTKEKIVEAVKKHEKRAQFVAAHPMAGTERSGPGAAIFGLFEGKVAVICDREDSSDDHVKKVELLYEKLKMRLVYMGAKNHDIHAAFVSHLSHISSFVLANTVLDKEKNISTIFDLAGGGFESTVRLAKSSPDMWVPIFAQNHEAVLEALESYIDHLKSFHKSLKARDWRKTRRFLEDANEIKRVLKPASASEGKK